jgi:diguanylate cyclase (GGDEF)-like protein/PAS domain S-box-containing protein
MRSDSGTSAQRGPNLDQVYVELTKDRRIFSSSLEESLSLVVRSCSKSLDVGRVSIWTLDADSDSLHCMILFDRSSNSTETGAVLHARDIPRYFESLRHARIIDADDARTDSRTRELAEDYLIPLDIRSMLDATLRFEGQLRGAICAEAVGVARIWTEKEKNFVTSLAELVDQMILLDRLRERESHYRSLFDHSADGIFIIADGELVDCNPAAEIMFETSREDLLGLGTDDISAGGQPDEKASFAVPGPRLQAAAEGQVQRFEWRHRTRKSREFDSEVTLSRVPRGKEWCVMAIIRDISARKQAERELEESKRALEYRAFHDSLTGLPNRDSFHRDIEAAIESESAELSILAVLLLDLNRFKEVNDTLGHDFGDEMLKVVAQRLKRFCGRRRCGVYRLGGDEFVLLTRVREEADATALAGQVIEEFSMPFSRKEIDLHIDTSIGISLFPAHGASSHSLLQCADVALYNAKRRGAEYCVFDVRFDQKDKRHLTLMSDLVRAIERDELRLHFHPRIDLSSGACVSCEALLRWEHPEHGLILPEEFIASAELNNLIHQLTRWVLRTALTQLKSWADQGINLGISVNVSARNLIDQSFSRDLKAMLDEFDTPTDRLEIELTESALIIDPIRALESLRLLRRYGVNLSVDDFGTGYSSMSYLKQLPVQVLKIDKGFVQDMLHDESDATIVRSIVDLAHSFGLRAVAEGVEEARTVDVLQAMQCDQAQGFYFCQPLPTDEFRDWLERHEASR